LGDLLLQVVFHAALAEERGDFDFAGLTRSVSEKMICRHPHVFGDMQLKTSEDVLDNWETFKRREGKKYLLDGIPNALPALMRAEKIQEKLSRVGYDWPDISGARDKLQEELKELDEAADQDAVREEIGDVLFAIVNIARFRKVEVEQALQATNDKVIRRFNYVEEAVKRKGQRLEQLTLEEMDAIWDEAKGQGL